MRLGITRSRSGSAVLAALLASSSVVSGCAHGLEVKNLDLYKPAFVNSQQSNLRVGLIGVTSTPEEDRLLSASANALKRDGFKVSYPYYSSEGNVDVDYVVKVSTSSSYKGSGTNFLVNFPGFLIWAPAWHGYHYKANYGFDIDITETKTGTSLPRVSVPMELDIRHADMNRTWTEISWLEVGAIALIGGIIFTRYDPSVTPLLVNATETRIADYTSSKIASALIAARESQSARSQ